MVLSGYVDFLKAEGIIVDGPQSYLAFPPAWGHQLDGLQEQIAAQMAITRGVMSEVAALKFHMLAEQKLRLLGWKILCTSAAVVGAVVVVLAFMMSN